LTLSFIVALAEDRAIGRSGDLPWRLPDDLKFFKRTTLGKPMLMGRKTWESLGGLLPKRLHIVVSSRPMELPEGVLHYTDLQKAIARMKEEATDECFVIGGGEVFKQLLPQADRLYLTQVHTTIPDADAFFPELDYSQWQLAWEEDHPADEKHPFSFTFQRWERK